MSTHFLFLQLLHLFEAESVSYLDEVASSGSLDLAKSVAAEVSLMVFPFLILLKGSEKGIISLG